MSDLGQNAGGNSLYRFLQPGQTDGETQQMGDDATAENYARQLSTTQSVPIIIERRDHVDWEYVTEVDERP